MFGWGLRDIDGATHFQGIAMQLYFCNIFCQNMLKNEISIISIHTILSTMSFQTFSGSFTRYCNEFVRRFDCDLRDIDGATHLHGMAMNFSSVFPIYVCQNMLNNEIYIHQFLSTISFKTFSGSCVRRGTEILKDLYTI